MERVWITNGSTSIPPVVNPLIAACHEGYLPTDVYILDNPSIAPVTDAATEMIENVLTHYSGGDPEVTISSIEDEADFDAISDFVTGHIDQAQSVGADVAVDVTPGRKFWSIFSFRAGLLFEVDRLYYLHVLSDEYFGQCYPTIPRTATELIDFTELI